MEVSKKIATAKTIVRTAASLAGTVMLARSVAQQFLPGEIQDYLSDNTSRFFGRFSFQFTMVIDQFDGFVSNQIFESAEIYLSTKVSPTTQRLRVIKPEKEKIAVKMERHEEVEDVFQGVKFKWLLVSRRAEPKTRHNRAFDTNQYMSTSEDRAFEVTFSKKYKNMVLESYIPYIIEKAKSMMQETRTVKIFTMSNDHAHRSLGGAWTSVNLDHPSTFDTLAMDSELKDMILKDLERFVQRKEHYRKIGKAWKRGYLLYGPPGTGKSSLIAAMANHLNFNIYDLELTNVGRNTDLRKLLLATANKSILVVEDIDCTIDFQDRNQARKVDLHSHHGYYPPEVQVTLSGLFNAIDGLWSSCGDERIIIFTTNHKEKLDPALLRPGRMDVHIHMSYCTPCGFRNLASTYLGIRDPHPLFVEIEDLIESTEVTPAEVAEQLLRNDEVEIEAVLKDLIVFLHAKREQNEEAKAKKRLEEEAAAATQKLEDAKAEKKKQSVTREIVPPSPTATTSLPRHQRGYTRGIVPPSPTATTSLPRRGIVRASINLSAALFVLFFLVSFLLLILF